VPPPIRNCKFKYIKFYPVPESLGDGKKYFRKVMEQGEITYLYWEIALLNMRFNEYDWKANIITKCYKADEGKLEMANIAGEINVSKDLDIYCYKYGWGTETAGYWRAGIYNWEVYIDNELIGTDTIVVNNFGIVSQNSNPYFDLAAVRLYPSYEDYRETKEGYRYLSQFAESTTEYIGIELELKRKQTVSFNYEFNYQVIKDNGMPKAFFTNTNVLPAGDMNKTEFIRFGWGVAPAGYWRKGGYLLYIYFMGEQLAAL
jgi:hypothetical protein